MRPSHLPSLGENAHPDTFLDGIKEEDTPQFFIALDGKPSDRYIKNGHYCLATLIASSINTVSKVGCRIQDELSAKGIKFQKLSNVRGRKRKNRYVHMVLDILIDISNEEQGLPI